MSRLCDRINKVQPSITHAKESLDSLENFSVLSPVGGNLERCGKTSIDAVYDFIPKHVMPVKVHKYLYHLRTSGLN